MGTGTNSVRTASTIPPIRLDCKEAALIRQILTGRTELLGDLIQPHMDALRRFIQARFVHAKSCNGVNVDDIVQQTVLKAFLHLEQFRFEACFRTWLIRIAVNEIAQFWRKSLARQWTGLDDSNLAAIPLKDPRNCPFRSYERDQAARLLQYAIGSLPEIYRSVVRMRDLEERSISEVADTLCLTQSAVKSRHHRARLRMARILQKAIIGSRK
jgi:RNA polymerase sigma-70 factor (ECF subfamily)